MPKSNKTRSTMDWFTSNRRPLSFAEIISQNILILTTTVRVGLTSSIYAALFVSPQCLLKHCILAATSTTQTTLIIIAIVHTTIIQYKNADYLFIYLFIASIPDGLLGMNRGSNRRFQGSSHAAVLHYNAAERSRVVEKGTTMPSPRPSSWKFIGSDQSRTRQPMRSLDQVFRLQSAGMYK